jgi:acetyl-CoA carboxylase carboxyl transferase subunit beta
MVVHRHDLKPTLARLCRLLTKSPAAAVAPSARTLSDPITIPAVAATAPDMVPAAPHA